jgi:hypothetical protein
MTKLKGYNKIPVEIKDNEKSKIVILTKLTDNTFDGNHPNGIYEGHIEKGIEHFPPTIGERYRVGMFFSTSPVKKINNDGTFNTIYSTYKLEYLNKNI